MNGGASLSPKSALERLRPRSWSIGFRIGSTFGLVFALLASVVLIAVSLGATQTVGLTIRQSMANGPDDGLFPEDGLIYSSSDQILDTEAIETSFAAQQFLWAGAGVIGSAFIAAGIGWFMSKRLLKPLDEVIATTQRITARTLHERIGLSDPDDEIARVAQTIDELLDRLEASFEAQKRFVAYASHELRTPLAIQRAALQIGLEDADADQVHKVREELLAINRRSEHLVESLLLLATADRGFIGSGLQVDIDRIVEDEVSLMAPRAAESRVGIKIHRLSSPIIYGDPTLIRHLVRNLISNAIEYNVPGGWVQITSSLESPFVIENSGRVITEEQTSAFSEPFVRGEIAAATHEPSSGARHSGLGLAIVASIARAHTFSLSIAPRPAGGLRVCVQDSSLVGAHC